MVAKERISPDIGVNIKMLYIYIYAITLSVQGGPFDLFYVTRRFKEKCLRGNHYFAASQILYFLEDKAKCTFIYLVEHICVGLIMLAWRYNSPLKQLVFQVGKKLIFASQNYG